MGFIFKKKMLELIKSIDIFGKEIKFNIKKNETFQTILGGFTSILLFGLFMYRFIPLFLNMINHKEPDTFLTQNFLKSTDAYTFSNTAKKNEFVFSLAIFDKKSKNNT